MNDTIKMSIIVPCYKVERFLPKCLDSLLAQTLKDIEIICINDGSPDNCLAILQDYQRRNPQKLVIIDKQNEGVWRGRYDGIAKARGEYIGFVDSDDYVAEDYCEKLYTCAKDNNADIAVCGFQRIDDKTDRIVNTELTEPRNPFNIAEHPERLLELNAAPWNKAFASSLMKQLPSIECIPPTQDDMMLHLLVYLQAKRVAFTPFALVYYILREGSIITTINQEKIDSTYTAMTEIKDIYIEEATSELNHFVDAAAFQHLGIVLPFRISCNENAHLSDFFKDNRVFLNDIFPTWSSPDIISLSNAKKYGGALARTWLARCVYKAHLMIPALACYRYMIDRLSIDIKW